MNNYSCVIGEPINIDNEKSDKLLQVLKTLACISKLNLLFALKDSERCVCELTESLGLEQSLLSHHLKEFKSLGLVNGQKQGRFMYYSLTPYGHEVAKYLSDFPTNGGDGK